MIFEISRPKSHYRSDAVEAIRKMIEKGWTSFEWPWIDGNNFGKIKPPVRRENITVPITRR